MVNLVLYGDFNCPYSCLASVRSDLLIESGAAAVEWRFVEHDQAVACPSEPVTGDAAAALAREVDDVLGLVQSGEHCPLRLPHLRSNTAKAIAAYAAADEGDKSRLRRALFSAYWFDGADIADDDTLQQLAGPNADAHKGELVGRWRVEWLTTERAIVPALVLPDGYVSRGLGALSRLATMAPTG